MFSYIFNTFFYNPLYNAIIFLDAIIPGNDIGIAIVFLTIIVRLIMLPLSHKSVETQKKLRDINPQLEKIKKDFANNKEEQAVRTMNLYKEHGINPFSGILLIFIQLPAFISLYYIFKDKIDLASPIIYSFTLLPVAVNTLFLGFIELSLPNLYFALLVGITQFIQAQLSIPELPKSADKKESSFGDDMAKSMNIQVKYVLPIFITWIATNLNAAVALFWIVNNLFGIGHEVYVKNKAKEIKRSPANIRARWDEQADGAIKNSKKYSSTKELFRDL